MLFDELHVEWSAPSAQTMHPSLARADCVEHNYSYFRPHRQLKMARHIIVKLPPGYSFEDIQNFEFKATSKSGNELISSNGFVYVTVSKEGSSPVVAENAGPENQETACRVPCIEMSTLLNSRLRLDRT